MKLFLLVNTGAHYIVPENKLTQYGESYIKKGECNVKGVLKKKPRSKKVGD